MRIKQLSGLWIVCIATLMVPGCARHKPVPPEQGYPISSPDIRQVTVTDNFWLPKIRLIHDTTIKYAFEKCIEEGRLENFLIAGKIKKGKTRGKMPFDDTDLYKIIEGASYSLLSAPDPHLEAYLDSIIAIIKIGQEPDGYITTWFTIDPAKPPADWVKPSTHRWENEISSHELYNSGHLFEAAAAHYHATGKKNLLDIATKNADLLVANFRPGRLQKPPGHEIVETGLIKLYQITGKKDYLKLSKYFIDLRGDGTTHPLYGAYNQDSIPLRSESEAVGHAVRAEYVYAAMTDIAAIYQDSAYAHALDRIWSDIVNRKMYITGGVGARHEGESFGVDYELPNLTAYSETCAAIGSVLWNQKMFMLSGQSKYVDIVERTLYNGVISGISADGKMFFYPNPLESDGRFSFNMGKCTRQSWFDCSCCPTNLIRFIPSLPGLIYATRGDTIFANLFISSRVHLENRQGKITLSQQTNYPWDGKIRFNIDPEKKTRLSLRIRVPGWFRGEPTPGNLYTYTASVNPVPDLIVNGKAEEARISDGWLTITREWNKGDIVELSMPMTIRQVATNLYVEGNRNKVAFERGPMVYCAEEIDNKNISSLVVTDQVNLKAKKDIFLGSEVILLTGKTQNDSLLLLPYFLWSNRGVGKMKVWLPHARGMAN